MPIRFVPPYVLLHVGVSQASPPLSLSPTEGTTAPGGSDEVTVTLDAAELAVGTHKTSVCVASNDPERPVAAVSITFTVLEADGAIALPGVA